MKAIPYKVLYIFVKVQRASGSHLQVVSQICRAPDGTELVRNWKTIQKFTSSKAAHDFGLQEARAWIDDEDRGPFAIDAQIDRNLDESPGMRTRNSPAQALLTLSVCRKRGCGSRIR